VEPEVKTAGVAGDQVGDLSVAALSAAPAPPRHPLHFSLARVRAPGGKLVGAGFVVADRLLCTCAHVVAEALGGSAASADPPNGVVVVDFPFLGDARYEGKVSAWRPVGAQPPEDVALLALAGALPDGAHPARLVAPWVFAGHAFRVCGFPEGSDVGVWARGFLDERRSDGSVQLEREGVSGFRVQPGFSGAPVWDVRERGVVGMVVSSWRERDVGAAFMLPMDALTPVDAALQPATAGGPWAPLTGGVTRALKDLEDFLSLYLGRPGHMAPFGGRERELMALDRWLADPDRPYLLVVADAGRGKSALLAHWAMEIAESQRAGVALAPISIRFDMNLRHHTLGLLLERLAFLVGEEARSDSPDVWHTELQRLLREERLRRGPATAVPAASPGRRGQRAAAPTRSL
jgi:hypothetical protein